MRGAADLKRLGEGEEGSVVDCAMESESLDIAGAKSAGVFDDMVASNIHEYTPPLKDTVDLPLLPNTSSERIGSSFGASAGRAVKQSVGHYEALIRCRTSHGQRVRVRVRYIDILSTFVSTFDALALLRFRWLQYGG